MGSVASLHDVLSEKINFPEPSVAISKNPSWLDFVIAPGGANERNIMGKLVDPTVCEKLLLNPIIQVIKWRGHDENLQERCRTQQGMNLQQRRYLLREVPQDQMEINCSQCKG
jgi:hypothetical protein